MGGAAAMMLTVPERGLSLAVLCNSTDKAVRDAVLDRLMTGLVPGSRPADYLVGFDAPAEPLTLPAGEWAGTVDTPQGAVPLRLRVLTRDRVEVELPSVGARAVAPATASARWALRVQVPLQLPTRDAELAGPLLGLELRAGGTAVGGAAVGGAAGSAELVGVARCYGPGDATGYLGGFLTLPCRLGAA
nr:hypothetical protein [Streptomyces tateyamensis]